MPDLLHLPPDETFGALRQQIAELDAEIAAYNEEYERVAMWLIDVIAHDPARFRAALGVVTPADEARALVEAEARETWKLAHIKRARLLREAQNG